MKKLLLAAVATTALIGFAGTPQSADKKTLAFVVNGASDFWKAAEAGVKKAQSELPNYRLVFKYPEQQVVGRHPDARMMDDLGASGVAGIMLSAVDPKTMGDALNRVGGQVALFTTDLGRAQTASASPTSARAVDAGKQAGQLMTKAMPSLAASAWASLGLPGADNARERIDGVKEVIRAATKIELVDVRADDIDQTRAKRNVEDTITVHPEINCMVGFYSYNTPRINGCSDGRPASSAR